MAQAFSDMDYPQQFMPDHDFVVGSCAFACGKVYLDTNSYLLHRRHQKNVTSGGNGILKRIKTEWNVITKRKCVHPIMADAMLHICGDKLGSEEKTFLQKVAEYRQSARKKLALLTDSRMTTGMWFCDAETKLRVLLGVF